ncbi:MAG TPA: DUF1064 domain-containing protein [Thermodesulfovibrionales bacterium]|nr:DUF1064 domain-containing protein [Thermodesulfovibrionales bacterium]
MASPAKYHNKKCEYKGRMFDSRRERTRYIELELWQRAGGITHLECQVSFEVIPKVGKNRAAHYIADFVYTDEHGNRVVEDSKGMKTDVYKLKKKLMRHVHGIEILET